MPPACALLLHAHARGLPKGHCSASSHTSPAAPAPTKGHTTSWVVACNSRHHLPSARSLTPTPAVPSTTTHPQALNRMGGTWERPPSPALTSLASRVGVCMRPVDVSLLNALLTRPSSQHPVVPPAPAAITPLPPSCAPHLWTMPPGAQQTPVKVGLQTRGSTTPHLLAPTLYNRDPAGALHPAFSTTTLMTNNTHSINKRCAPPAIARPGP
jgi:hypothetical protein